VTEIPYVTREEVASALDVKPSAFMSRQIDRACLTGSRLVDGFCHRTFAPVLATKTFDYPGPRATSQRIWFDQYGLISATAISSGGTDIASTDYLLRPDNGPDEPFEYLELDRLSGATFSAAAGSQRAVSITGLWGYSNVEQAITTLSAAATSSALTISVTAPAGGVGSLLRIGSERMLVTAKAWVDSGITSSTLTASASSSTITTASAAYLTPFEKLLIDGERVEVLDVAGSTVTVRRAVDGTTLAAHSNGAAIYWEHQLTVTRAINGTTAATQADESTVYLWTPPSAIAALARAYAIDNFLQENAGYARTAGQGENERPVSGRGIAQLEARVRHFVRGARSRAV
jgi:hypothetical protein